MNLKELIEYYDLNIDKISVNSKHYDSLSLMRSKVGSGRITNEPHIDGKHYWINNRNVKDNESYNFFYIQNIKAYEVLFDGIISFSAHISVISILGRNNFGVDFIGGYYVYGKKKVRSTNKIAILCVNKLRSNHYDCVIEPCKDGISKECVLLPGVKPLQYEPVSLNANLNIIYRRTNMKGKYIKSGTSNFVSNDGDFPLVAYIAETYRVDDETGEETDERDYDAEQWEYDDAYDSAKDLADKMNIPLSKEGYHRSLDDGYYNMPYSVGITSGYYEGIQIQIEDNLYFDPEEIANDEGLLDDFEYAEDQADYDRVVKEVEERVTKEWETKINEYLNKLCSDYGWMKLGVSARFSNGETWYSKIDSAKKNKKRKTADEKAKDEGADITCARRPVKSSTFDNEPYRYYIDLTNTGYYEDGSLHIDIDEGDTRFKIEAVDKNGNTVNEGEFKFSDLIGHAHDYYIDLTNTGYYDSPILRITPSEGDITSFTIEAVDENGKTIAKRMFDFEDILNNAIKSSRRPIKSSNNDILYKCKKILDKYGADYRGGEIENINGKNYITFRYYGGPNDTVDQNDDSWDEMYDLDGVVDVGYGEGYGDNMEGTNYHNNVDCLIIELDDKIESSKKLTSGQKRNRDSLK